MIALHFTGEGKGFYAGVKEYVIIADSQEEADEKKHPDWIPPGFKLRSETDTDRDELPGTFPINTILVARD